MYSITMKTGDRLTLGKNTVVQLDRANQDSVHLMIDAPQKGKVVRGTPADSADLRERLECLAKEIDEEISALDAAQSKELSGAFVPELCQKQAAGIAAAKAKGVKFGRARTPLPDNFDECRQAWRDGELSLREAADSCGMGKATFQRAVVREERTASCAAP